MLPQHLVCKYELNCEYCNITLARNKAPWWWSDKIETCRSVLKCFMWNYMCIRWLINWSFEKSIYIWKGHASNNTLYILDTCLDTTECHSGSICLNLLWRSDDMSKCKHRNQNGRCMKTADIRISEDIIKTDREVVCTWIIWLLLQSVRLLWTLWQTLGFRKKPKFIE